MDRWSAFFLLAAFAATPVPAHGEPPETAAIRAIVDSGSHPRLNRGDFHDLRSQVSAAYEPGGFAPLWLAAGGVPTPQAEQIIDKLLRASEIGLLPGDYDARWLDSERHRVGHTPELQAELDTGLTVSLMRYVSDAHLGRIDPRQAGFKFDRPQKRLDLAAAVRELASSPSPTDRLSDFEPPFRLYRGLASALARLRNMAVDTELPEIPSMPVVRPGEWNEGVPAVRQTLALLGYLEPATVADRDIELYDDDLAAAVAQFQQRHGLESDAAIGRQTLRQLRVPLSWRVRQIEMAMERLRWLPYEFEGPFLLVNIPEFRLRGFISPAEPPVLSMGVVVGSAAEKTKTPVLFGEMRHVIFRPYWNVPGTITRDELLPSIRRNPGYVSRHHYEIVPGEGGLLAPDAEGLALLEEGGARLRQRPGANNALGLVKFIFPNPSNVYLHDTPAKALFRRSRRDFSHGCIRVENPIALAKFVLGGPWDEPRIRQAMVGDDNHRVTLPVPVQVLLFYTTALVDESGEVFFYDDIYGHDERLARLLAKE